MAISGISMGAKSLTLLLAVACLTSLLSGPVEGKDIIVGDAKNWTLDFNYTAWAENKTFTVGDNLVFNYPKGAHDVYMVSGAAFRNCSTEASLGSFATGNDGVPLKTAGNMWFLCSVGNHCENGMKFKITVFPAEKALAPQPAAEAPSSRAAPSVSSAASAFTVVMLACMANFLL